MTSEPLYKSIYYELKKKIEDGLYSKDDYLPTENKLSKKYNVSRVTIRQAIQMLVEDGYVQKKQGSGTHVIFSPIKTAIDRSSKIKAFSDEMRRLGKNPSAQVLKFEMTTSSKSLSEELEIKENDLIYYYERTLLADDQPYCFEYGYMPISLFSDFSIAHITGSKMKYIEKDKKYNVAYTHQIVHAILANEKLHNILQVPINSPLLEVTHIAYIDETLPLHKTCTIFDSTKYQAHYIKIK